MVVTVVVGIYVVVGWLVTVTVLVLVDGGGTSTVVVTVETLPVVEDEMAGSAAMTPQATRLTEPVPGALPRLSALWWTISALP